MKARIAAIDKEAVRERSRTIRDRIAPAERLAKSEAIHDRLYEVPWFRQAGSVAIYFSTGSEVLTGSLAIRLAEQEQRRVFLPFVLNDELQLTEWRPSDPVVDAPYGGMHPRYRRAVPLDEVEVIVLTGIAFDRAGARLGEGTGKVDDLLRRLPPSTVRIGIVFSEQLVPEIPHEVGDERVHAIVSEEEIVVVDRIAVPDR